MVDSTGAPTPGQATVMVVDEAVLGLTGHRTPDPVAEIAAILGDTVELMARPAGVPDVVEDADTLVGNARLKARAICAATGRAMATTNSRKMTDRATVEPICCQASIMVEVRQAR